MDGILLSQRVRRTTRRGNNSVVRKLDVSSSVVGSTTAPLGETPAQCVRDNARTLVFSSNGKKKASVNVSKAPVKGIQAASTTVAESMPRQLHLVNSSNMKKASSLLDPKTFAGKTLFFDVRPSEVRDHIRHVLSRFGATVTEFLCAEVDLFITDKPLVIYNSDSQRDSPVTPAIIATPLSVMDPSPSPLNLRYSGSGTPTTTAGTRLMSRKSLSGRVKMGGFDSVAGEGGVLSTVTSVQARAHALGIRIVRFSDLQKRFDVKAIESASLKAKGIYAQFKQQEKKASTAVGNNNNNNNNNDKMARAHSRTKLMESILHPICVPCNHDDPELLIFSRRFLKVERLEGFSRPYYRSFDVNSVTGAQTHPVLDVSTPAGLCPIRFGEPSTPRQRQSHLERRSEVELDQPNDMCVPRSKADKVMEKGNLSMATLAPDTRESLVQVGEGISEKHTVAVKRRKVVTSTGAKKKKKKEKNLNGYCECCLKHYTDLKAHLVSPGHREFAEDDRNFYEFDHFTSFIDGSCIKNVGQGVLAHLQCTQDSIDHARLEEKMNTKSDQLAIFVAMVNKAIALSHVSIDPLSEITDEQLMKLSQAMNAATTAAPAQSFTSPSKLDDSNLRSPAALTVDTMIDDSVKSIADGVTPIKSEELDLKKKNLAIEGMLVDEEVKETNDKDTVNETTVLNVTTLACCDGDNYVDVKENLETLENGENMILSSGISESVKLADINVTGTEHSVKVETTTVVEATVLESKIEHYYGAAESLLSSSLTTGLKENQSPGTTSKKRGLQKHDIIDLEGKRKQFESISSCSQNFKRNKTTATILDKAILYPAKKSKSAFFHGDENVLSSPVHRTSAPVPSSSPVVFTKKSRIYSQPSSPSVKTPEVACGRVVRMVPLVRARSTSTVPCVPPAKIPISGTAGKIKSKKSTLSARAVTASSKMAQSSLTSLADTPFEFISSSPNKHR